MTPERWQQVEALFAQAIELPPADRKAFLDRSCRDDHVRCEVESLLTYSAEEGQDLGGIVEDVAALMPEGRDAVAAHRNLIGQTLGPYKVVQLIGQGGMGEIYAAEDPRLGRQVALKLLPSLHTGDVDRVRRFQLEARAASALNHPNIVTIFDIGQTDGAWYIATELVQGRTLRQMIGHDSLPFPEIVGIALQMGGALAAAHAAGIVHRDIKPENVMVRPDGYIKVLDFGLAKLREPESVGQISVLETRPGVIMGTAQYMSPEQARGLQIDARSDLFSLGVVLYEMVCRQPPFRGETGSDVLAAILRQEPEPLDRITDIPGPLEAIIRKCLRKDRDERYQTAPDLLADLRLLKREFESSDRLAIRSSSDPGRDVPTWTGRTETLQHLAPVPVPEPLAEACWFGAGHWWG